MIEIQGLTKCYGKFQALHEINLKVSQGEFLVVLGPSGAGKSTLLRCINRLAEPTAGTIRVGGETVSNAADLRRLRCKVAMIFQHYNVVPRLTVIKNVITGRLGSLPSIASWFHIFPKNDIEIARQCLKRVELTDKVYLRTDTLSGGQKQRVGIARALAQQPQVILADEPVASLDPKTSRTVLTYIKQASQDLGITVICNLHQVDYAKEFAERIVGVSAGRIVFDGPPEKLTEEILQKIYPDGEDSDPVDDEATEVLSGPADPVTKRLVEEV